MAKTLVTHINPHLDDIFAIWLLKKFHPDFKDAQVEFISASRDQAAKEENKDKIFIGTGGGKFDEHKEGLHTCAGSLVFDYLKQEELISNNEMTKKALAEMVEWNKAIDMGTIALSEYDEFSPPSFIRTKNDKKDTSLEDIELGRKILDRIFASLKKKQQSVMDWEERVEFTSRFGKTYAVSSQTIDRSFCKRMGGDLFLIYNPKYPSVQYFTPSQTLDLAPIYEKVKSLDKDASWYLHQSHHIVLCGSSSAPDSKPTKLSFEQLIEAIK